MMELRIFLFRILRTFDIKWADENPKVIIQHFWIVEMSAMRIKFSEAVNKVP